MHRISDVQRSCDFDRRYMTWKEPSWKVRIFRGRMTYQWGENWIKTIIVAYGNNHIIVVLMGKMVIHQCLEGDRNSIFRQTHIEGLIAHCKCK